MPPARSASARSTSARSSAARSGAAPRRVARPAPRPVDRLVSRSARLRVRWERVGRYGLLLVLTVVVGLYVEHTLAYVSTRSQADQQQAVVRSLRAQNLALEREQRSLNNPATIVGDARTLGMVRPDEQPYVIPGLSNN
jgi:cell division protein FtsB